jgi:pyruvate dehydrogenase E2 component (dihydrolipoamide acetyltransferase)
MPTVIMPKMGDAMEEGTLLRWLKNAGDEVAVGDPIAEIETDKVTLEIEAADAGTLSKTLVAEGAVVPIGTAIATIGEEDGAAGGSGAGSAATVEIVAAPGETPYEEGAPFGPTGSIEEVGREAAATTAASSPPSANGSSAPQPQPQPQPQPVAAVAPAGGSGERLRASPLVKRLAAEHGIDLSRVSGSGPAGRIVKDDIAPYLDGTPQPAPAEAAAPAPTTAQPAAPAAAVPTPAPAPTPVSIAAPSGRPAARTSELSRIKRTTGRRMIESVTTAPHFFVTVEIDMDAAIAFRDGANAQAGEEGTRVSFNDLVVKAAALALRTFPNLNASLENDLLHEHPNIDVNIAVALPEGLIAPFVPDADQKSLGAIARMAKDLVGRARSGGLKPEEYQGGTFTVSNLGMFEVDEFISIINPPQAAILAVGSIRQAPVVKDGEIAVGNRMKMTLSADHRVTDGAEVARFLAEVKRFLEHPMLLALG